MLYIDNFLATKSIIRSMNTINPGIALAHFKILKTERLILRQITPEDVEEIFELLTNKEVNKHYGRPRANKLEDACKYIQKILTAINNNELCYWGICMKGEQKIVGTVCLWNPRLDEKTIELGYELLPQFQRKGIMQEVLPQVIRFAFEELKFEKIDAWPNVENERSLKLLEKHKFQRDNEAEQKINWEKEAAFYRENEKASKVKTMIYSLYAASSLASDFLSSL